MSEATIIKQLANAYKKAGKILGRNFNVYRPVVLNDSLSASNFLKTQDCAFTLNKNFTTPQTEGFKTYIAFTKFDTILVGDIFNDATETFVIVWNRSIEEPVAIRATHLVEIHSVGWDTTNGLHQTRTRTSKNVPASVTKASSTSDISISKVSSASQANRYEVRIWSPTSEILQTDNIVLADGTVLHIDSVTTSELSQIFTCSEVAT